MPSDEGELSGPFDRWATWVFAVAAVVAVPTALYAGRAHWFFLDDFDFLATRRLGSFSDLMRSHNGHWSTLPIIEYRILYRVFGLNHYWPYQVVLVLAHVATASLLYLVMRRARVQPWIATAAGVLFLFLGSGADDIEWGFQIGFTAALVFGLAFLVLVDHDGPNIRRDLLGALCGLAALLCSGVGVAMVAAVGVALLLRRGWRVALTIVAPLAVIFLVWYVAYGRNGPAVPLPKAGEVRVFVWTSVSSVFGQLTQVPLMGWVLFAVLVAGAVMAVRSDPVAELRSRYAAVTGLLFGGLVFVVTTTISRGFLIAVLSGSAARVPRYLYVIAAFLLPAIAAAASALAKRRIVVVAMVVLLLIGLPGNVELLWPHKATRFALGQPAMLVALAASPLLAHAPADLQPFPFQMPGTTVRWVRNARSGGKLPMSLATRPIDRNAADLALSLDQVPSARRRDCRRLRFGESVTVDEGDEILIPTGQSAVTRLDAIGRVVASLAYLAGDRVLRIIDGPMRVQVSPPAGHGRVSVCT